MHRSSLTSGFNSMIDHAQIRTAPSPTAMTTPGCGAFVQAEPAGGPVGDGVPVPVGGLGDVVGDGVVVGEVVVGEVVVGEVVVVASVVVGGLVVVIGEVVVSGVVVVVSDVVVGGGGGTIVGPPEMNPAGKSGITDVGVGWPPVRRGTGSDVAPPKATGWTSELGSGRTVRLSGLRTLDVVSLETMVLVSCIL